MRFPFLSSIFDPSKYFLTDAKIIRLQINSCLTLILSRYIQSGTRFRLPGFRHRQAAIKSTTHHRENLAHRSWTIDKRDVDV
jgi:hypothetical protein